MQKFVKKMKNKQFYTKETRIMEQCLNKIELCNSCKKTKCDKSIVITTEDNLTIIKCLDYEKDETKIHPYKKPLKKTARLQRTVMGLSGCDWR